MISGFKTFCFAIQIDNNLTCIKGCHVKWSPSIKQSVVKVPDFFPLTHSNFHLFLVVT